MDPPPEFASTYALLTASVAKVGVAKLVILKLFIFISALGIVISFSLVVL